MSACHGSTYDDCSLGVCDAVDAGSDGQVGPDGSTADAGDSGAPDGPSCDSTKGPSEDPCVVTESAAIFVDGTSGVDANEGTKALPKKTLAAALTAAKAASKRVYVCEGTYAENLVIDGGVAGIFGGFDCATWGYDAGKIVGIKPTAGTPLTVKNVTSARFEDVSIEAANAVGQEPDGSGRSSIGVFVANSQGVVLRRVKVKAGHGTAGAPPQTIADYPSRAPDGKPGTLSEGGGTQSVTCPNSIGKTEGGAGGAPGKDGTAGTPVIAVTRPDGSDGAGGKTSLTCSTGGTATDGSSALGGASGSGAKTLGAPTAVGWGPGSGQAGGVGGVGQGGGGGAGRTGGGGGGGAGGCGGSAGAAGRGGGSSVGVLAVDSAVSLAAISVGAGNGAAAGPGGKGQRGQLGSLNAGAPQGACSGGVGGHGGGGGGGGGGAGGLSVGILYRGTAPMIDGFSVVSASTRPDVVLGTPGAAGGAGAGGDAAEASGVSLPGAAGTAGIAGVAEAVKALQ